MMRKTVVVYSPSRFADEVWLPTLWSQCKTYYERHGVKTDEWHWAACYADVAASDLEKAKSYLLSVRPQVFAVSLYVWNYDLGHALAQWVKQTWPQCLIITGGPHQYFKYDVDWFKKYPYIDLSLPGECFGELCMQEVLDNVDSQGYIDPDVVTDIYYPKGQSRLVAVGKKSSHRHDRKDFDFAWSSYHDQQQYIVDYVDYARQNNDNCSLLGILETTRGCPYGCTYCDWGGGINTTVIKKPLIAVEQDIRLLAQLDLKYLYLADANFGMFESRDLSIMQMIVEYRHQFDSRFGMGYGGWAKSDSRLSTIHDIIKLDLENNLSSNNEIKISIQTLHADILKNINRRNIDLGQQLQALQPLSRVNKAPLYVEMILGLPGMTLDKFYQELDILAANNLSAIWYEWLLLPESPAYDPNYRNKFKIRTCKKYRGWAVSQDSSELDVVVSTESYSTQDYLQMLIATSWYHAIIRGGALKNTVTWIKRNHNIGTGQIIKMLTPLVVQHLEGVWNEVLSDSNRVCHIHYRDQSCYFGYAVPFLLCQNNSIIEKTTSVLCDHFAIPKVIVQCDTKKLSTLDISQWQDIQKDFYLYRNSGKVLTRNLNIFDRLKDCWIKFCVL